MSIRSILAALSVVLAAATARADYDQVAKDVARRYAEEGIALHDRGDYAAAVQRFTKAYRVLAVPTVGIRLARSLALLGHFRDAAKTYQEVIAAPVKKTDPPVFAQAITDARAELAELTLRVPTLTLTLDPGVTSPTIDGVAVPLDDLGQQAPIDPGEHRIGGLGASPEALTVHEGDHLSLGLHALPIAATPAGAPGPNWKRIAGISSAGLAGVSLVVGVVGSLQARAVSTDPDFTAARYAFPNSSDVCADSALDPRFAHVQSLCSQGKTGLTLQLVFYPAAVVFAGVSTYLLLTSGKPASPPPATRVQFLPHVGPSAAGLDVTGTF